MAIEIGSYLAKTKLPELLRGVQAGNRYTITIRGQAIADLVPVNANNLSDATSAVDEMLALMESGTSQNVPDVKSLIEEGRL